ncbi:bacteriocin ABC transporter ATP-binding protein [Bacillus thuringiensis]|uniref:ABC transporter ATP-binding protein n=1 Tax=Bacillus TaxID=1386 RepID=UPI0007FB4458|nr:MULTISPECIES: ABC transporter ATP-binding protein [Bacillus]MED3269755.1 ABC transporter ATP-binding protein [Bacillus thuringiensis]OBW84768.1 bacteriocin ABC transporter ATP-binding protein [Bacillus cereus]PER51765.1 bacteriocin ABC transporter ATP-binding protein [Bacillus thuringiensis]PEX66519.1 bacteriocin ABC transporter ATP-binding protein [Bacillus cereus]PFA83821.1 bacteriocin ABC transporter ATP-binding protein [Bacillus thuringiensis]
MNKELEIKLDNITKNYGDKYIFQDFNLDIYKGEFIGIIGKSGSGKSTLLNIMGLLDEPNQGRVLIQGNDNAYRNKRLFFRNTLGYIFQNYALMDNETVGANLEVALKFQKKTKLEKRDLMNGVLTQVGLSCSLKTKVYTLSGGEQQRLAVARILLKKCDVILADEPTGSLDKENRDQVINLLKKLHSEGKTIIVVTHDMDLQNLFSRVVELK